jgi:hypothetical protein
MKCIRTIDRRADIAVVSAADTLPFEPRRLGLDNL